MICALGLLAASVRAAGPRTFTVDPERSRATIDVGKSGAFSFAGHTHEVDAPIKDGVVHLDADAPNKSDVKIDFNAAALRVTGKGESKDDVPKVQETMVGEQVLDVKKFPTMTFESTRVSGGAGGTFEIVGNLTIKGVTREVTLEAELEGVAISPQGHELIGFAATAQINREDFGLTYNMALETGGVMIGKDIKIEIEGEAIRA